MDDASDYWEHRPDPSDEEIAEVCRGWVRYEQRAERITEVVEDDPDWWAIQALMDSECDRGRENILWRLILCLCSMVDPEDEDLIGMIAAGPMTSMIFFDGEPAMDRIEPAADEYANLLGVLSRVWCDASPVRPRIDRYLASRGRERR